MQGLDADFTKQRIHMGLPLRYGAMAMQASHERIRIHGRWARGIDGSQDQVQGCGRKLCHKTHLTVIHLRPSRPAPTRFQAGNGLIGQSRSHGAVGVVDDKGAQAIFLAFVFVQTLPVGGR